MQLTAASSSAVASDLVSASTSRPFSLDEYKRYGRQMIMPGWGLPGQLKVKSAKVAVIGAGGLGCPVLQYLAGAGVGTIGTFDPDTVDTSNLHRQILHTSERVGMNKAESAVISLNALNPHIKVIVCTEAIDPSNAIDLLRPYHLIVDCTDRPLTRYLLSDTSVLLNLPLISGAAISSAGQWAVYGGTTSSGKKRACYRCMWPSIVGEGGGRCDEEGVWGPVVGMVGVAMAGEVLKVIMGKNEQEQLLNLFHLGGNPLVRTVRIRPPSPKCIACGPNRAIRVLDDFDYDSFCAGPRRNDVEDGVNGVERISPMELSKRLQSSALSDRVIIDTRPSVEYAICAIPSTSNISLGKIISSPEDIPIADEVAFICRRGHDSLVAAQALSASLHNRGIGGVKVIDVRGGLEGWSKDVDPEFPVY